MSEAAATDLDATDAYTPGSWTLTPAEFAATKERAAAINARAAKRGFTGRIEVTGTEREITETDATGLERTRTVVDTRISGEAEPARVSRRIDSDQEGCGIWESTTPPMRRNGL